IQPPILHIATGARRVRPNGFHQPFFGVAMWITGCHDTKDFWNAYWQRYAKLLRNRPFSPQIIRENL
ncbi:MAG: hypothetical protein MR656_07310, partial [Bacteroidales bacterium]|nr:hypothetical protein [Bacteroidales bacterium]